MFVVAVLIWVCWVYWFWRCLLRLWFIDWFGLFDCLYGYWFIVFCFNSVGVVILSLVVYCYLSTLP